MSSATVRIALPALVTALRNQKLLLLADTTLPSVASMVAGEPVRASWWGHPAGHAIFDLVGQLASHPDTLVMRLVSDKVTFVHRQLWESVLIVARSGEPWQTRELSRGARTLLARVERAGTLEATGPEARTLESRLLVHGQQFHTTRGSHARLLEAWDAWARRAKLSKVRQSLDHAKSELEEAVSALNAEYAGRGRLPWQQ